MTYQELQNLIVSRFWSDGLKREIEKRDYVFPPRELMGIAYNLTDTYDERLRLMALFAEHVPEVAEHAKLVIRWQEQCLADFRALGPNELFELEITLDLEDEPDHYLCASYDAALEMIDRYFEIYDCFRETPQTRYTIIKRKIHQCGDYLDTITYKSCDFGPGKKLLHVYSGNSTEYGECGSFCFECDRGCIRNTESLFPSFLPDLSPVRFRSCVGWIYDEAEHFGLVLTDGSNGYEHYIIPLDSEMFQRDLEEAWGCLDHEHILWPDAEGIEPDVLPPELRVNFDRFAAFWKIKYPEKYKEESP